MNLDMHGFKVGEEVTVLGMMAKPPANVRITGPNVVAQGFLTCVTPGGGAQTWHHDNFEHLPESNRDMAERWRHEYLADDASIWNFIAKKLDEIRPEGKR